MTPITRSLVAVLAAAPLGLTWAGNAHQDAPSVSVNFADLDVGRPEGVAMLYRRIRGAAEQVCHPLHPQRQLAFMPRYEVCLQRAVADAVARSNLPALTRLAAERNGSRATAMQLARR